MSLKHLLRTLVQAFRFGWVGLVLNVVLYVVFLGIAGLGVDAKIAVTITFIMGTPVSYWSHRQVSFQSDESNRAAFPRFVVIYLSGYAINMAGLYVLVDCLDFQYSIVQAALVLSIAAFGFVTQKIWVFKA